MVDNLYKKAAQHVTGIFEEYSHPNLVYHNLEHTQKVVERTQEIAAHYQLKEQDMLTVYIASWFHDVGHLFTDLANHEKKSIEMMKDFMNKESANEGVIGAIESCITATRIPHEPTNLLEEILCDADTYHFGTKEFKKTNKRIKREYELRKFTAVTMDWEKNTVELLEKHHFFTTYCQALLSEGKERNIESAKKKYFKAMNKTKRNEESKSESEGASKQKMSLVTRGIQTMLRLTSENHLRLSDMADGKANILISVNAIIISVILSVLIRKLEVDAYLTIPTILFLISSVATIIIAILATMPKISAGNFSKEDVINKTTTLLFFGNFYKSSLEEYEWGMDIMMKDKDYLYGSLIKDIHHLGKVLGRKYKLIRLAYMVFMIGIIVTVLAFTVASLVAAPENVTTVTMPADTPI